MPRYATKEDQTASKRRQRRMNRMFGGRLGERAALRRAQRKGQLSPAQAADARGLLSETKTPMGAGNATIGAGASGPVARDVQRTILAGAVLYVEGLAPGDTIDSVVIDGINVFQNGPIGQGLLNPTTFNAPGLLIVTPITQNITVNVTNNGAAAADVVATLLAPSEEANSILDHAADACDCD